MDDALEKERRPPETAYEERGLPDSGMPGAMEFEKGVFTDRLHLGCSGGWCRGRPNGARVASDVSSRVMMCSHESSLLFLRASGRHSDGSVPSFHGRRTTKGASFSLRTSCECRWLKRSSPAHVVRAMQEGLQGCRASSAAVQCISRAPRVLLFKLIPSPRLHSLFIRFLQIILIWFRPHTRLCTTAFDHATPLPLLFQIFIDCHGGEAVIRLEHALL